MKTIVVPVTEVSTIDDDFTIDGRSIKEQYRTYELNEWDEYAIEEAVQYAAAAAAEVEVVTVTIGRPRSDETIRLALAKGADRAIRVWDDTLEHDLLDSSVKASILGRVIDRESPEIVLTGVQSSDAGFGATGVALAAEVDYQWAAVVNQVDLDHDDSVAVHRELEGGLDEVTTVELPAVLTIQTGINDPQYASLRGIREAQNKPLEVLDFDDLGVKASSVTGRLEMTAMRLPESEGNAQIFEGEASETAVQLADQLRAMGVATE